MRKPPGCPLALAVILCLHGVCVEAQEPATLKSAFGKWFDVGTAIPGPELTPAEQTLLLKNFTNVTPEGCMKPPPTEPQEGKFTFGAADAFVAFAQTHGLKVNGHTLVWHHQCPGWYFVDGDKPAGQELVLQRMRDHITTEVSRYRGKVFSWDVVNEALDDGKEYLRRDQWLASAGPGYLAEAYKAAQKADPAAELYYNDYGIESPRKRANALRLIHELKAAGARLDGIGIQGHWQLDKIPYQDIEDSIIAFHHEGLKVMITELDVDMVPRAKGGADASDKDHAVDDPYAQGIPAEKLARQAEQYARLFALFRKHADQIARVTFWGLDDGRSWLNSWPRKRTNYPLLWDRNLEPKPAFAAVIGEAK